MKHEGYKFPVFKESDAMFTAAIAPDWKDGDRCHRCRVEFTHFTRRVRILVSLIFVLKLYTMFDICFMTDNKNQMQGIKHVH